MAHASSSKRSPSLGRLSLSVSISFSAVAPVVSAPTTAALPANARGPSVPHSIATTTSVDESHECPWSSSYLPPWLCSYMHVEYTGFYSLEKLLAYQLRGTPSPTGQIAQCWLASLPTFVAMVGLELLPLDDPSRPWTQNPIFFIRQSLRAWLIAISGNMQIQELMPQLRHPWPRLLLLALLQIVMYVATIMCIAHIFCVFPVPLSSLVPIPPTMVLSIAIRYVFVRCVLEQNPELKPQHARLERLTGFTFSLILLYCVYGFVFRRVGTTLQIVLALVLYIIKQFAKHRMWTLCHIQDHHDLSAESVSCGVHLFHALYTITCLQSARSHGTFAIVLSLNMAQDALAYRSLQRISRKVDTLFKELQRDKLLDGDASAPFHAEWTAQLVRDTLRLAPEPNDRELLFHGSKIMLLQSAYFRYQHLQSIVSARVHVSVRETQTVHHQKDSQSTALLQRHARATHAVAHLLHCREVVLLRLFVDVFVPLFYLVYCSAMLLVLPTRNRLYVDSLTSMDARQLLQLCVDVCILVVAKLLTISALCSLLRSHGQPPALEQLAFVIRAQRWTMQCWFVMNVLQIVDFPLAHNGNDLSFRFRWLQNQ